MESMNNNPFPMQAEGFQLDTMRLNIEGEVVNAVLSMPMPQEDSVEFISEQDETVINKEPLDRNYREVLLSIPVDGTNGASVTVRINNNGSVWTNFGQGEAKAEGCNLDSPYCGNNVIIESEDGVNVLARLDNVEGAPEKTTEVTFDITPEEGQEIANRMGVDISEITLQATLLYDKNDTGPGYSLSGEEFTVTISEPPVTTTTSTTTTTTTTSTTVPTTTTAPPTTTQPPVVTTTEPPVSSTTQPPTTTAEVPVTTTTEQPPREPELAITGPEEILGLTATAGFLMASGLVLHLRSKHLNKNLS